MAARARTLNTLPESGRTRYTCLGLAQTRPLTPPWACMRPCSGRARSTGRDQTSVRDDRCHAHSKISVQDSHALWAARTARGSRPSAPAGPGPPAAAPAPSAPPPPPAAQEARHHCWADLHLAKAQAFDMRLVFTAMQLRASDGQCKHTKGSGVRTALLMHGRQRLCTATGHARWPQIYT